MKPRARLVAVLAAAAIAATSCSSGPTTAASPSSVAAPSAMVSPRAPSEGGSAAAVMERLCRYPAPTSPPPVRVEGPTPPAIAAVEDAVEEVRDLTFMEPVPAKPESERRLKRGVLEAFGQMFPSELYARRTQAWRTIGVIPPDADIRASLDAYGSSQVIGYYDPASGELAFLGTKEPSPMERITLAHELAHAIDDQHFGLQRLDELTRTCQDEAASAALGLVEGSATYFSLRYAQQELTLEEQLSLLAEPQPPTGDIPSFILNGQAWSYLAGLTFVRELVAEGGTDAVDAALRDPPVSTEQVIHPERYPSDRPQRIDVPDLGAALGDGWHDLDVLEVGEAWLSTMLALRLDRDAAAAAAAGWDGGLYRAWTDGRDVAVVLSTVWDTPGDASEFAGAIDRWIADSPDGRAAEVLPVEGTGVRVLFASNAATLEALASAAG